MYRKGAVSYEPLALPDRVQLPDDAAAGTAPSGANHQPWHFAAIADPAMKARIRATAEDEGRAFYAGGAGGGEKEEVIG